MSLKAMAWVWDHADVKGTELLLLLAIADQANDQGEAWPSIRTLTKKIRGESTRNTQIVARKLEEAGQLLIDPPRRGRRTNTFTIPVTEVLQAKANTRVAELQRVKALAGVEGESPCRGGVKALAGVKGEENCRGGVNQDSPEPSFNHQSFEPSVNHDVYIDYDMPWQAYPVRYEKSLMAEKEKVQEQGQEQKTLEREKTAVGLATPCAWGTIREAWDVAEHQLALQLGPATMENYIRKAHLVDYRNDETIFVFRADSEHIRDHCANRLNRNIAAVLRDVCGQPVNLQFEYAGG